MTTPPSGYFQQLTNGSHICKLYLHDDGIVGRVYEVGGRIVQASSPLKDVDEVVAWFGRLYGGIPVSMPIRMPK